MASLLGDEAVVNHPHPSNCVYDVPGKDEGVATVNFLGNFSADKSGFMACGGVAAVLDLPALIGGRHVHKCGYQCSVLIEVI